MPTLSKNIVISAVLAMAAAAALFVYVSRVRDQASSAQRTVQVVVATADIPAGTSVDAAIASNDFGTRTVLAGDAPSAAVSDISTVRGEVVTQELFQGDTVTANRLGSSRGQGESYKVTGPFRLIRLPVFPTQGLLGDAQIGDRVDIFAKTTNPAETRDYESLVVRGALVVGVDSIASTGAEPGLAAALDDRAAGRAGGRGAVRRLRRQLGQQPVAGARPAPRRYVPALHARPRVQPMRSHPRCSR
jgi:Flp pilus assembly protein CpaB